MLKGCIGLFSAVDLFEKLKGDYEALLNDKNDSYKTFNFFVTAEHIPDWIGNIDIKNNNPYLRICSHLATGAKHFNITNKKKNSVDGYSVEVYVKNGYVESGYFETVLVVNLSEKEAEELGVNTIELTNLAKNILEYWDTYFKRIATE